MTTVAAAALMSVAFAPAQERPGDVALVQAIQQSDLEAVKRSIQAGANVNLADKSGTTPLMHAAIYSDAACIRLLLDKGADPNTANQAGATALMWSAGNPEKIRLLLAKDAAVNARANSGRTALSIAAQNAGNIEGVNLLLAKGADVRVKDAPTGGPVLAAALAGDEAILRVLLAAGGDPNERNRVGLTPLMAAASRGKLEPSKILLDAGAEVNAQSGEPPVTARGLAELGKFTPLIQAASQGNPKLVQLLLDHGADVKAKESRGMTPLMLAAASEYQDPATVQILIAAGSDISAKANDGQTAPSWAEKQGGGVYDLLKQSSRIAAALEPATLLDTPHEASIRGAVEKTIALLQSSSTEYFQKSGCSGCHHQMLTGMAVGLARDRGFKLNEQLAKEQVQAEVTVRMPQRETSLQGLAGGGDPMSGSLLLVSLAAQAYPADSLTTALTHLVAGLQLEDGSWGANNIRQPIQHSVFSDTAYAVRALQYYSPAGRKPEYARRIERARIWLQSQRPVLNEDRVKQLLGLMWAGEKADSLRAATAKLLAEQLADGGWAQRPGFLSDAYATGQTLCALNQAGGIRSTDPAYLKGVSFLRRTQLQDGSWHVRSRAVKFQPYFESGFPHGHDQWISAAASAWAAMALTLAAESPAVASR
jgi:ankyrin repeat protein